MIIADEPSMGNYYGSVVATPYAKLIFEDIIKYKKITPENLEEDLKKMERNIEVPNLVGLSLTEAVARIVSLGLQYEIQGEGDIVKMQSITPNELVYLNSLIVITMWLVVFKKNVD